MATPLYIFAGGGTGGHLFPGLAVAHALRAAQPDARILFLTTDRPLDAELLDEAGFLRLPQPVRPFSTRPWRWPAFWLAWRRSVAAARGRFEADRPRAVLGLGGYAAGPAVLAAAQLGIRSAILNPDAIPGRANRYLARRAQLVVLQWDVTRQHLPPRTRVETLGCPIRAEFAAACRAEGVRTFGLDPARPVLLVTGASQGARTINAAMTCVWPAFVRDYPDWQLLHLTGAADEAATRTAYERAGVAAHVLAFTHEMALALATADVVVSRAGASTLAELTALGKPSILLPYPYHRDRHQHANAQVLVEAGAAVLIDDQRDAQRNAPPLLAALRRLSDPTTRQMMAEGARRLGRPAAATEVAHWMAAAGVAGPAAAPR